MNEQLKPIESLNAARAAGKPLVFDGINVTCCEIHGRNVLFATDFRRDPIQRRNRHGQFYEPEELEIIRRHFPPGGVFVDIGSNVGNHALYVGCFLSPSRIVAFEPNPKVYRLLYANMAMNGLLEIADLTRLGIGLGDAEGQSFGIADRVRNLGASRLVEGEGDIPVHSGDSQLRDENPTLIKIDVEGMEIKVLNGLAETVERCRPKFFVEVDDGNAEDFAAWCASANYRTTERFRRYPTNENHLIVPIETNAAG